MSMNILVTGGAGYIGSHTVVELLQAGHDVTIIDNLSNSSQEVVRRIRRITGNQPTLHVFNLQDTHTLDALFAQHDFDAVIHFAGLKAVGESVANPLLYYRVNVDSTLALLETMQKYKVKRLVFSSSATVYGSAPVPYTETGPAGIGITSPYGQTKYIIERIITDAAAADPECQFTILRYFNPVGAHPSGLIGEDPSGVPNNLMPFIAQVASGRRKELSIFGNDYDTPDGTAIRDYIHVVDLAKGHVAALMALSNGVSTYNLGSGKGTSVLEMVAVFKKASGKDIPYVIAPRRAGDLPAFYADPTKAIKALHWKASLSINDMCQDTWNWQTNNPMGYTSPSAR